MDMFDENVVLCVSNSYEKKYYFNPDFDKLPDDVKNELKIMCVLFTEVAASVFISVIFSLLTACRDFPPESYSGIYST